MNHNDVMNRSGEGEIPVLRLILGIGFLKTFFPGTGVIIAWQYKLNINQK